MTLLTTFWWLGFFTAVGLCLGSFLNVVIYRLPKGLAISRPLWSFCPICESRIAWYDNIPVLSYLLLRGRCRTCRAPISPKYPLVELLTAMVVVTLFDAFFVEQSRPGLQSAADLTWRVWDDWPIFIAHVILLASLLAMSAIDLQFYWVDIRFTHFAAFCGVVLHVVWTPSHSREWYRPSDATGLVALAAFLAFAVVWLFLPAQREDENEEAHCDDSADASDSITPVEAPSAPVHAVDVPDAGSDVSVLPSMPLPHRIDCSGVISLLAFLGVFVAFWTSVAGAASDADWSTAFAYRAAVPLACAFVIIVFEASRTRETDGAIAEAIECEAPAVRRQTLLELAMLTPSIVLGGVVFWLLCRDGEAERILVNALHWRPLNSAWQPLWGLTSAIAGYVIAAGIGWSIRILANLLYGKEAFATGDIHMMAAAGAVAGWNVVLLGFMLTCGLALLAWVVLLPFKRGRVIPLGPWLTIGFWASTLFYKFLIGLPFVQKFIVAAELLFFNNSQP